MKKGNTIQKFTLYSQAYNVLKGKILNGEFPPGFRLQENILIEMLGTSKSPIGVAVARLIEQGLVRNVPRKGNYVIEMDSKLLYEVYTLRESLEALATRITAAKISENEIGILEGNLSRFRNLAFDEFNTKTIQSFNKVDEEFHYTIIQASEHSLLQKSYRNLSDLITMFKLRVIHVFDRRLDAYQEHLEIFKGLRDKNPLFAEEAMTRHIRNVMDIFMNEKVKV